MSYLSFNTVVEVLDGKLVNPMMSITLEKLYQHFIHLSDNNNLIDFKKYDDIVKIKDWYGWSDLLSIRKINSHEMCALVVWLDETIFINSYEGMLDIHASPDFEIHVYNDDTIVKGYHGETKYNTTLKQIRHIEEGDKIRLRHETGEYFAPVFVSIPYTSNCGYNYEVISKSGKFNANDFLVGNAMKR